jgi:hypothetical protein
MNHPSRQRAFHSVRRRENRDRSNPKKHRHRKPSRPALHTRRPSYRILPIMATQPYRDNGVTVEYELSLGRFQSRSLPPPPLSLGSPAPVPSALERNNRADSASMPRGIAGCSGKHAQGAEPACRSGRRGNRQNRPPGDPRVRLRSTTIP